MQTLEPTPAALKRVINDTMRDGLRAQSPREPIPFFCECDKRDCFEAVWRTGPQYDDARRDASWRALPEHAPSEAGQKYPAGAFLADLYQQP